MAMMEITEITEIIAIMEIMGIMGGRRGKRKFPKPLECCHGEIKNIKLVLC